MDWSGCPLVVSRPGYLSGKPALRDDPRVPPEAIVENMDDGMTAHEVAMLFDLKTAVGDIQAVYDHVKRQRALHPV